MLRNHCRQWFRKTRYQAHATPYLGSTCTGCIAPALPGGPYRIGERDPASIPVFETAPESCTVSQNHIHAMYFDTAEFACESLIYRVRQSRWGALSKPGAG
jgi:hypothetical protein